MPWFQNDRADASHCPDQCGTQILLDENGNDDKRGDQGYCLQSSEIVSQGGGTSVGLLCTTAASAQTGTTSIESSVSSSNKNAVSDMTRRMVCGGLAGMIAKTVTNPLERIKMLSQTGDHLKTNPNVQNNIIGIYKSIVQQEGIIGLWAGNGANLIRIFPAKAIVFSTNDMYKTFMFQIHTILTPILRKESSLSSNSTTSMKTMPSVYSFFAGGFAGMTASFATYPLDLARGRISGKLASSKGHKAYKGIIQTCVLTIQDEGLLALYKGVKPTLIGAIFYEGIKFGTVGALEKFNSSPHGSESNRSIGEKAFQKMIYGGCGGIMAAFITYPNDTVRRLLQLQGSRSSSNGTVREANYSGYWDCVKKTYQAHGIKRFYHGLTINVIRMAPNAAIQFGSYELLKQWTESVV
jgi:Mitochondrial carrier protein